MNKTEKIILIISGISLVFFTISMFLPSPGEGSTLETIMLIPIFPIIIGIIILVQHRSDLKVPLVLRIIGFIVFILWILSFFIKNPFRG